MRSATKYIKWIYIQQYDKINSPETWLNIHVITPMNIIPTKVFLGFRFSGLPFFRLLGKSIQIIQNFNKTPTKSVCCWCFCSINNSFTDLILMKNYPQPPTTISHRNVVVRLPVFQLNIYLCIIILSTLNSFIRKKNISPQHHNRSKYPRLCYSRWF